MDNVLKTIFEDNGVIIITGEEDLELEIDSIQFLSVIVDIEETFKIEIPDDLLIADQLLSFNDFYSLVQDLLI